MPKRVNVLLSAYNGEAYLAQQADSIFGQEDVDVRLFVRDDASSDKTVELLQKRYSRQIQNGELILILGNHIGYRKAFFELLEASGDGEYWAFSDQDDVWLPDKLSRAIQWLKGQPDHLPALFHGSYQLTDETLRPFDVCQPPSYPLNLRRMITDCVFQGFSLVINRALRQEMLRAKDYEKVSHDWLAGMIAVRFGSYRYDDKITAMHRRLPDSVSSLSLSSRLRWFFGVKRGEADITRTAQAFEALYRDRLSESERELLSLFTQGVGQFSASVRKAFYPARWRARLSSEVALRLLMLIGKV